MNPLKKLAGQTVVYGMGTIVPRLLNYMLLTPFYTRIFQKGEYGVVTELYAYVAFLLVLLTYGMETAFFRYSEVENKGRKVYSTALISLLFTSFLFLVGVVLFYPNMANWIHYSSTPQYILYFGIIVVLDAIVAIPFARLRQQNQAGRFALLKVINVGVNIGLNVFFLTVCPRWFQAQPEGLVRFIYSADMGVGYAFIANLIASGVTLLLLIPDMVKSGWVFDFKIWKKMMAYGLPLLVVGLAGMVNEHADKIILKYLLPDSASAMEEVGVYGASFKLAVLMTLFIQMFRYAAEPFFFAQAREANSKTVYAAVMNYFIIFGLMIFLGVTLFMDGFKFFIGSDFREGIFIVPIIMMGNLLLGIFYNLSVWYKLNNLNRFGAYIALGGAFFTLATNVVLVPRLGFLGSAWGHLICYTFMVVCSFFLGRKYFPIHYPLKRIGAYFLLAGLLYFLSVQLDIASLPLKMAVHLLLFGCFVFVAWLLEHKNFKQLA